MKSSILRAALFLSCFAAPAASAQNVIKAVPLMRATKVAPTSKPAQAPAADAAGEDEEELVLVTQELEQALEGEVPDAIAMYTAACAEHGTVELLIEELDLLIADEQQPAARRNKARWVRGSLLRRRGDFDGALEAFEEFAKEEGNVEARLQVAELLDAKTRVEDAITAYEELLPMIEDGETLTHVRVRLALLQMEQGDEHKDALAEYAREEGHGAELRNRAAVVLGLIDRPADAIDLYTVDEQHPKRFRQEVRVAEWAIVAEDATKAQEFAWRAVEAAKLKRDRFYALTVLVEAHRMDESLGALADKFAATPNLDKHSHGVWVELLRELERYDEAIELYTSASDGDFTIEERRELLEMYREKGDEVVMIGVYRELIAAEPSEVEWREGLSRAFLERGDRAAAIELWREFLELPECAERRLEGAAVLMDLSLDELAIEAAELGIAAEQNIYAGLIFLFNLHKDRGHLDLAEAALERMEAIAPPGAAERFQLADSWEQLGRQDRAVKVLEAVREARGAENSGEDLEMRLAWLYSEVGEEEIALVRWREIWTRIKAISRRRYAEDRMMTVASRLGSLADIAIDLEQKLVAGTANERDSGLLVRLYTKVGDPVSAAEVIDEFMKQSGGSAIDTLQEKGRVYLACNDYYNYEKVVRQLIELDKEGEGDYLRQLAMSQLERGKPDEARVVLGRLKEIEAGTESAEFEAGVLALAGLREDAIRAYRKGIATNPGRIESYLLMANLMKEMGETDRAVGMFQYLAETAERDDLFTIAIDGLLNVEAPKPVMQWARRITLERLASRHDKMYLYQLLADLAEQVEEREGMLVALENSLSISGERRPSVLRELMELAKGGGTSFTGNGWQGDEDKHLAYGRRLIGLAEIVPPQVYLDLGDAFLKADDPLSATKTFRLASDLPDYPVFQRQAAGLFEQAGFRDEALDLYKRVLVAQSSEVGLIVKVGELEEQEGRDGVAMRLYAEALELLFSRQPLRTLKAKEEHKQGSFFRWYGSRNIDDFDKHYSRLVKNLLVVLPKGEQADALLAEQSESIVADLTQLAGLDLPESEEELTLGQSRRIRSRANFHRRLAIAYERPELADELDLQLLAAFPDDKDLLESLCQQRVDWGLYGSVRRLLDRAPRDAKAVARLRFLVGDGLEERSARRLPIEQATSLFLPLLMEGKTVEAGVLLRRTDFGGIERENISKIEPLFSASLYLEDGDLTLQIGREWTRLHVKHRSPSYQLDPVLGKCKAALDTENYRNLCLSFADQVLKKPEETSGFLTTLSTLQDDFDEPLISEEQVMDLLDDYSDGGWGFGLGPVILLLPEDKRGAAMRTVWSKVRPTSQVMFLMNFVGEAKQELGETVSEFVEAAFVDAVASADDIFSYYVSQMVDSEYNEELVVAMVDALVEHDPEDWVALSGRARKLLALEREEEALEAAKKVYIGLLDAKDDDWQKRQARDQVLRKFLPDHLDVFMSVLDAEDEKSGATVELVNKRLDLLRRGEDKESALVVLEEAVETFPEEVDFLESLRGRYLLEGRREEAMALLERMIEIDSEHKSLLLSYWNGQQNPIAALAVKEELMAEDDGEEEESSAEGGQMISFSGGMVMISASGSFMSSGGDDGSKASEDKPTIQKVKDAAEAEDWTVAQTQFRRLWREFPKGESQGRGSMVFFFGGRFSGGGMIWPKDEENDESAEDEDEPYRGGLDDWSDDEPEEQEEPRSAYDALAEYDFGVDEMQRLLRSKSARELDQQRVVFEGLLRSRILRQGAEATLAELVASVGDGRAGKLETTMLLTLLDEHPELQSEATANVLADLARSVRPVDIGPLRALARVQARQGNVVEARRLYTWLATRTEGSGYFSFDSTPTISQRELLKDVKENLEGEERLAVIEAVTKFADPGDWPYARERFELLVLDIYMELLEPADALERSREILAGATDFKDGLRRGVARRAAALWAQNGQVEEAIKCLEYGICKLEGIELVGRARWAGDPKTAAHWNDTEIRRLFPKDGEHFSTYTEWLLAANEALLTWREEDRVRETASLKTLIIISLRLNDLAETETALATLRELSAIEDLDSRYTLWIADALRQCGDTELANSIERKSFDAGLLELERTHEVIGRELETSGPEAALALGAPQTEYSLNERLLEVLIAAAEQSGNADETAKWIELRARAEAATKRLEEIAEEEEREAEEEE